MMASAVSTTTETLALLEERIRRISFALNGSHEQDGSEMATPEETRGSAIARLKHLEGALNNLSSKSIIVNDILALQSQQPDIFNGSNPSLSTILPAASLLSMVLAHVQLYHSVSGGLSQLQDAQIPDAGMSTKLIELQTRIEKARARQDAQNAEVVNLQFQSAKVLESWYEGGLLNMDERWADWEDRLRSTEIALKRREAARKRDEGNV